MVHDSRLKFNCLELSRMMAISLKSNLSIPGTKFDHLHTFDCGNTVAVYDVTKMYGLNQIIGHAKFNNKEYGEVLYRGETKLHSGLIPSLFRKCTGTTRWDQVSPLVNKILQSEEIKFAMNAGVDHKMARHKVEGMLQHYGIQTRFIDLVDNHWVALWMGLHKCCETKKIQHYYHYEKRRIPIVELATGASVNVEDLYQYILMLALPKSNNAPIDGIELTDEFVKVDLRQALPSVFLRPHSQHGLVARKKVNPSKYAKDYDMASQVIGILRIRIDYVDQWLGNGQLLSQDNLFPNAMNDYGYDLLLQLPDDFIPKNFAIAKYV